TSDSRRIPCNRHVAEPLVGLHIRQRVTPPDVVAALEDALLELLDRRRRLESERVSDLFLEIAEERCPHRAHLLGLLLGRDAEENRLVTVGGGRAPRPEPRAEERDPGSRSSRPSRELCASSVLHIQRRRARMVQGRMYVYPASWSSMSRTTPPCGRIRDFSGSWSAVMEKFFIVLPHAPNVMPCICSASSDCFSAGSMPSFANPFNAGPKTTSSRASMFCHPPTPAT